MKKLAFILLLLPLNLLAQISITTEGKLITINNYGNSTTYQKRDMTVHGGSQLIEIRNGNDVVFNLRDYRLVTEPAASSMMDLYSKLQSLIQDEDEISQAMKDSIQAMIDASMQDYPTMTDVSQMTSNKVPMSRQLSINGVAKDLSTNPSWSIESPVNADWNSSSGRSQIINKPVLSGVAVSGSYTDLSNRPTIPASQVNSDWNSISGASQILNKPTLSAVALSGSYNDLTGRPAIPPAQVNADWASSSGVSQIINKPSFSTVSITGSYNDLQNKPSIPQANVYTAGLGLIKSGLEPLSSFRVDETKFTSITLLNDSLSAIRASINTKMPSSSGYTDARARAALSAGQGIAYNATTGQISSNPTLPTINNNVSRPLNSNFTISATQRARVSYTVRIAYTVTALLGSTGIIVLQYSINGGSSWISVSQASNNIFLGVIIAGFNDYVLSGSIPANALVRLNSTATNAINTYQMGQETLE